MTYKIRDLYLLQIKGIDTKVMQILRLHDHWDKLMTLL